MKKIFTSVVLLSFIFLGGCQKEKIQRIHNTPKPFNYGDLVINHYLKIINDTIESNDDFDAVAHFTGPSVIDYVSVDSVSMNGTQLLMNKMNIAGYYQAPVKKAVSWAWHVKGNNGIPNFDRLSTTPFPSYPAYATLPDSINRSQDLTIYLTGLDNVTDARMTIHDNASNTVSKSFYVSTASPSISIPASELSILGIGPDLLFELVFTNETDEEVDLKRFTFQNSIVISKRVTIY